MESRPAEAERARRISPVFEAWTHIRTSPGWIVAIALLLRVGWIIIGHTYKFKNTDDNFGFGWEMGRIGASLASGHGFSSPFGPATGPTAWEPPLYPYVIAGVFRVFGIYSKASAFALLTLNSIFSALTCVPIFMIGRRIFSEKVAVGSAWAWALLPNVIFWCTRAIWETSLAALLLTTLFWLALTLEDRDGWIPWLKFGLLWGITALSSTSLLSFLPAAGLWAGYRRAQRGKRSFVGIVLGIGRFLRVHHAVAGPQLSDARQVHFHSRQFRRGTSLGKWQWRGRHMDGISPPNSGRLCDASIPVPGRTGLRRHAQAAGGRLHQVRLRAVYRAVRQEIYILLGWTTESDSAVVDERGEELAVPGVVGADVLGIRSRPAIA